MKRLISALLALVLALTLPVAALAAQSFRDVEPSHWAYEYIEDAASAGIVNGMGDGLYEPGSPLTIAQFTAIVTRTFYAGELRSPDAGEAWYAPYVEAAEKHGIFQGVDLSEPDAEASRYQMARLIYNAMLDRGCVMLPEGERESVLAAIADRDSIPEDCLTPVANVYHLGIINGIDSAGTFAGEQSVTRAQAAAVYCRMAARIGGADAGSGPDRFTAASVPLSAALTDPAACLTVGGSQIYALRMSEAELISAAGEPDDKLASFSGLVWYVYGTDTYEDFFMAGVYDGTVAALCSAGVSFSYLGCAAGAADLASSGAANNEYALTLTDKNDNGVLHAVCLLDQGNALFSERTAVTGASALSTLFSVNRVTVDADSLDGEARVVFYLTNAFRHYHGLGLLEWSEQAAMAAELHSRDMAELDYISHTSADGRSPWERIRAQGISFSAAAENICGGYANGLLAYNAWVNSDGHRENLLHTNVRCLGVGFGYREGSYYTLYATQDFYG